jgi:DNA-binding NarL/FixJ family response regulator
VTSEPSPPGSIRVLIVDDHPLVREGLRARLARVPDIEVVADLDQPDEALRLMGRLAPHVVLTDIELRRGSGIELTRAILREHPQMAVLILTMHDNTDHVAQALEAGARGYLLKDSPSVQVVGAIRSAATGGTYISADIAERMFTNKDKGAGRGLSVREREILGLLARGMSSKQIAQALAISVRTVESHRRSIKRTLNIEGQAELIKVAVERFRGA